MNSEPDLYHLSLIYRLDRKLRIALCKRFLVDRGTDHTSTVYIAGTGRSGTTWLSDLINYRNEYRQIFEPFHPHGPVRSSFPRHLYLRPDDADATRLSAASQVLSGHVRGYAVDRFNKRYVSSRRVIKDISSNLFLKWLHDHFPEMPIVFLMRHPCGVLQSQHSVGWERRLDRMLSQEALLHDFIGPFMPELTKMRYTFEQHIAMWCIQNYVPLRQFRPGEIHVMFYEDLCVRPEQELRALFGYLGKRFDTRILASVGIASLMAGGHSAIFRGETPVGAWTEELAPAEVRRAMEIVSMFGLDAIYSEDPMPNPAGVTKLLAEVADGPQVSVGAR
jgi:hypothetical protein